MRTQHKWIFILTLAVLAMAPSRAHATPFCDLPDTTEFETLEWSAPKLTGGVRSITTGDYDQDGDEDVFVTRFAQESLGQKQFVMYWNQFAETGELKFKVAGNGDNSVPLVGQDVVLSIKDQSAWDNLDNTAFSGAVTADFNEDGWPDIFVGGSRLNAVGGPTIDRSLLYINLGNTTGVGDRFLEVGLTAGLADTGSVCTGAAVADFNRDGLLDIFLANNRDDVQGGEGGGAPNILYMGTGFDSTTVPGILIPTFADSTMAWGVPQDSIPHFDPTVADFDSDGDLDLFVGLRQDPNTVFTPNQLLVNGGTSFTEEASSYALDDNGNAYGACWGDIDNDGDLDLLLSNNTDEDEGEVPVVGKSRLNKIFVNRLIEQGPSSPFDTLAVPDFAQDFALSTNNGGFFFDYDLDSYPDFVIAVFSGDYDFGTMLFHQGSANNFTEDTMDAGAGMCPNPSPCGVDSRRVPLGSNSIYSDFDHDGDLDLFLTGQSDPSGCLPGVGTFVVENKTRDDNPTTSHYLTLHLKGGKRADGVETHEDAIGSIAHVYVGSNEYTQQVCAGAQDGASLPADLTFGLGSATSVDSVVVDWIISAGPSPYRQHFGTILVDQNLLIKIDPDTTFFPQDAKTLQLAIDQTLPGKVVAVNGRLPGGDPAVYNDSWIMMKSGVKVVPQPGTGTPTIDGKSYAGQAVGFPDGVDSTTVLEGFIITGGTTQIVHMGDGSGVLRNCTIQSSSTGATMGINITDGTGAVEGCTVDMGDENEGLPIGIHVGAASPHITGSTIATTGGAPGTNVTGIEVEGGTPIIDSCTINTRNGSSYSLGVDEDSNSGGEITNCFIKSVDHGIWVQGSTAISFCTIDSTYNEGIQNSNNSVSDNCIVTNVVYGSKVGIIGGTVRYCIAPDDVTAPTEVGNSTEDPYYCGQGDYTLRADSYGNPDNNPSEEQIGAYPVACLFGSLARDVSWDGSKPALPVLGDVTVSSGRSLTLTSGAQLEFAKGDNQGSGSDYEKSELIINGTLEIDGGGVVLTSGASPDSAGDWWGVHVGGAATIDSVTVEDAVYGVYFDDGAGSLTHSTLQNNDDADVYCANTYSGPVLIEDNVIHAHGARGIFLNDADSVTVRGNTITNNPPIGIDLYGPTVAPFHEILIEGNTIQGGTPKVNKGIKMYGEGPKFRGNTIKDWQYGVYIEAGGPVFGIQDSSGSGDLITNNQVGVLATGDTAEAVIRECDIVNGSSGVITRLDGYADLGRDPNGPTVYPGNNDLSGNSTYCIWNRNTGGDPIQSHFNYYGTCSGGGVPPVCWEGSVDVNDPLCTAPSSVSLGRELVTGKPKGLLVGGFAPNPLRGDGLIYFSLEEGIGKPSVQVFDVAGRLVWDYTGPEIGPGEHHIRWDAAGKTGQRLASGMYFIRVVVGDERQTVKVLVTR